MCRDQERLSFSEVCESKATQPSWYALHTRYKQERKVGNDIVSAGFESFVPTTRQVHRWTDRDKYVDVPLFPCYVFVHIAISYAAYSRMLSIPGVLRWVGIGSKPSAISEVEVDGIKKVLTSKVAFSNHPFPAVGQRVRVRGGCLDGLEGLVLSTKGAGKLLITIGAVQQAISISLIGYSVEPV